MKELTFSEFYQELASSKPAPGGGSASALCASLSAALLIMGLSITFKADLNPCAQDLTALHELGERGFRLAEDDSASFMEVMQAYKLPKETEAEKNLRSAALQKALKKATDIPLKIAETGLELLRYARKIAEISKASCITDVALGGKLALVALEGGLLNVKINLNSLKDEAFKGEVAAKINEIASLGSGLAMEVEDLVKSKL
jgi:formiminotetrahydrofolate cyclodeaminase